MSQVQATTTFAGLKRSSGARAGTVGLARRVDLPIAALTVLGLVVAAHGLGAKSLWFDEAASVEHARLGLTGLWKIISGGDTNMGLYYVLLHVWVRVFGYSETAVRSLSVVCGALAIPVIVLLGTRLFGRATGLVAGLLLALSPFFVQYEQTARSYALVVLLVSLSSYFFVTELHKPSRGARVGYVLVTAAAFYTHYFAALVVLVQLVTLLAVKRRGALTREWITAVIALVLLCAPEAVVALRAGTGTIAWIPQPSWHDLLFTAIGLMGGGYLLAAAMAMIAGCGFACAFAGRHRWHAAFVAAWLVVPLLLVFAASQVTQPLFVSYYLIIVVPPLVLLAAAGVVRLPGPRRATCAVFLIALVILSGTGIASWYNAPAQENYRGATNYILGHERPGDAIIVWPANSAAGGIAYYEQLAGTSGPTPVGLRLGGTPLTRAPRVWLVIRDSDTPLQLRSQIERGLVRRYAPTGTHGQFINLTVALYRAR